LFWDLKRESAGFTASSAGDILTEIRRNLEKSPEDILTAVYNEWMTEHKRQYYHTD
jgi:hypothetical protein